ncbi:MAG: bifunctional 2',3'-cyclic-nucleotide 2'-phosphodiesterase/3'-nucleotidase [Burkholderiales bacterium]|nr:MAG: bifunctional 2',3'-cyclic-nucleotide 2'-phosphodiesterase/3'-nucleotidase [Burkholderiales bacterium]
MQFRLTPLSAALCATLVVLPLTGCDYQSKSNGVAEGTTMQVALLSTTDLHQNLLSYDYYRLADLTGSGTLGLAATASVIKAARAENPNNLLFDNGDATQGTLLGDFQALAQPVTCAQTLAIYKAMNSLKYDAAGLGNHEFNYGLPFLSQTLNADLGVAGVAKPAGSCGAPSYPVVNSNVTSATNGAPILPPYVLLNRNFTVQLPTGESATLPLKIAVLGFVPPQIMDWDAKNLTGKVAVTGVLESAQKYVAEARSKGADLVVALSHGGLDASAYSPKMENGSLHLTTVPGLDALITGHSHLIFPAASEPNAPKLDASLLALPTATVDSTKGLVNNVPTVMAQSWGRRLGIIKLNLVWQGGKWVVQKDKTSVESRGLAWQDGKTFVTPDADMAKLVDAEHQATIAYAKQPLGVSTDFQMSAYFSLVGDVSAIQIVNQAQIDYVKTFIANSTDATLKSYAGIPVISCSAPFKAGRNGAGDFTDVAPGASSTSPFALQVRNPGDLYLYGNNNIQAVKIKGADLKNWLETSAKQFGQIDPTAAATQDLVPSYSTIFNFDVFYAEGNALTYQIDVTKPVGSRIVNLRFQGQPVADTADFIVATNDYRAGGGGNFPGIDGSKTIIKSPDANQAVVAAYLRKQTALTRAANGAARSWSFVKTTTAGPVVLRSAPGKLAVAQQLGLSNVTAEGTVDASGYARYAIDLSK